MRSILIAILVTVHSLAYAQGNDAGIVNLVAGNVTYTPARGATAQVRVFMKVREGDHIKVPAGGQIRVLYFESGRQERWSGASAFRIGKTGSEAITGKLIDSATLPAGTPQRIAQVPRLVQIAKLGGIQVRGMTHAQKSSLAQQEAIAKARATYESMRTELPSDDISPELYLFAALYDYLLYDEMKTVVAEMRRKQPDNEEVKALETWVTTKASH